jgi:hypothetical protein
MKRVKYGGRQKGEPNKITNEVRQSINCFIQNNIETMQNSFDLLPPKEKLYFMEKLLKYIVPVMGSSSANELNTTSELANQIFKIGKNEFRF